MNNSFINIPETSPSPATILVVDDIAANRDLLRKTLEPHGYEVLLAPSGDTALKVAQRAVPDVILLDVNMPGLNGYDACRQLKENEKTRHIPVIFITANEGSQSLVECFRAGGIDYISKPFKAEEVLIRVETHLKINRLTLALVEKNAELESEVRRRKAAEDKANEANEAKSRFLSFISHEMRSPLNAIIGFSEDLTETLTGEALAESREDATRIRSASGHLLGLINNLLDLSKIEAGKMPLNLEDFEIVPLISELGRDLEPLVRRNGNRLVVESNRAVGNVHSDATKLKQVLMNLISNAGKFTRNGEIRISVRQMADAGKNTFEIAVADSGIGMTGDQMRRLFQPYQQATDSTAKQYGGTGLGLAISREFCRLMGGELSVSSEPGKGSIFTVTLPARITQTAEAAFESGRASGSL